MALYDDTVPLEYPYLWKTSSTISLDEFLVKYKPSLMQNDGTKPWLWVRKSEYDDEADRVTAIEEGKRTLQEATEKIENIQNDASIPIRANKKKGIRSKKELREEAQQEAAEKLKEVSIKYGYTLIFSPPEKVDRVWNTVTTSLIRGPLSKTNTFLTKVSTSPQNDQPNYQHVLCIYLPDVYNKDHVTEVMKILLRSHGLSLSGVKSDLYTLIGLDSKHPSGIQSTIWRPNSLMKDAEIKEMKDAFYAELNASKPAEPENATGETATAEITSGPELSAERAPSKPKPKPKPKLRKKVRDEDPFVSDEEGEKSQVLKNSKPPSKGKGKQKFTLDDNTEDDDHGFESDNSGNDDPQVKKQILLARTKKAKGMARPVDKKKTEEDFGFEADNDDNDDLSDPTAAEHAEELKRKKTADKSGNPSKRRKSDEGNETEDEEDVPPKRRRNGRK